MLRSLSIKNIAVIENVSIDFGDGFNILTGETGAGKSIIIDSINLLKGGRTNKNIIRNGEEKARVDALFDVNDDTAQRIADLLGTDKENEIMISREISADGRGSARINSIPVNLGVLKEAGELLADIHGQHDNTSLLARRTHIGFLDSYARDAVADIKEDYCALHKEYKRIEREIEGINTDERETARRAELLTFQIDEIDSASLAIGEDTELEDRKTVLENAYKIASATSRAYSSLYEGDDMSPSSYDTLWTAIKALEPVVRYDKSLEGVYDALSGASDVITENARLLKSFCEDVESAGGELDEIESRLEEIHSLKLKYGRTIEQILKRRDEMEDELSVLSSGAERLNELQQALALTAQKREAAANRLTRVRKEYAEILCGEIISSLAELCMPKVVFDIRFASVPFRADGADDVEFVICTNAGEGLRPLTEIASGGELSRIMLAIKGVLQKCDGEKLIIFDEVDTGVSGAAAQSIGEKLWNTSRYSQVVCITHLPQIAAMADNHYLIQKQTDGGRARTKVFCLEDEPRLKEVARMLGGAHITDAALNNASELIRLAGDFKSA